jgi:hypothetical protein
LPQDKKNHAFNIPQQEYLSKPMETANMARIIPHRFNSLTRKRLIQAKLRQALSRGQRLTLLAADDSNQPDPKPYQ